MRLRVQSQRFPHFAVIDVKRPFVPHVARSGIGANPAEQIGHRFGIAHGAKKALNPGAGDRGKEIPQVHAQDHALAHVGGDERPDGPPFEEPMRCGMRRDLVKNPGQNLSLQFLEPRLGRFYQSKIAGSLRQDLVVIVP